jgi:chemotaxis protein methyltransferase WspC
MAMALCDACVPLESFAIDAVDISAGCVSRAAQGIYGRNAFRAQDLAFRERYFTPLEGSDDLYRIASSLQQRVRFRQGNVLAEGSAPSVSYDIVFCRNLLIYFDRPTAAAAAVRLSSLLSDDGILFAGYAEVPVFTQNGFVPLPHRHAFAMRKALADPGDAPAWAALPGAAPFPRRAASATAAAHRAPPPPATPSALAAPGTPSALPAAAMAAHRRLTPRLPASAASWPNGGAGAVPGNAAGASIAAHAGLSAAPRANRPSVPASQATRELPAASAPDLLAQARRFADQGKLNDAAAACRSVLAGAPETAEAYFILALLAEAGQNPEDTEQHLKRCLYLKPDHYEALCHLAMLVEQGGNRNAAAHLKARAARVYQRQHASR